MSSLLNYRSSDYEIVPIPSTCAMKYEISRALCVQSYLFRNILILPKQWERFQVLLIVPMSANSTYLYRNPP